MFLNGVSSKSACYYPGRDWVLIMQDSCKRMLVNMTRSCMTKSMPFLASFGCSADVDLARFFSENLQEYA